MTERQLQARVGMFTIVAMVLVAIMVFQFGSLKNVFHPRYEIAIHFTEAPGLFPSTPVRMNGITIGSVKEVTLDNEHGGVLVIVEIDEKYRLRTDSTPSLRRTILGDSSIEFTPGVEKEFVIAGTRLHGLAPTNPMDIVNRLEKQVNKSVTSFEETSAEWKKVGVNINHLMFTNRDDIELAIQKSVKSLDQFSQVMQNTNKVLQNADLVLGDKENQANLKRTLAAMPKMVEETQQTIAAVRQTVIAVQGAVEKADQNLENLQKVTEPLGKRTTSIVVNLDATMTNLKQLSGELNDYVKLVKNKDGSLNRMIEDPELYNNLNRSAAALNVLLKNIEPIMKDAQVFSDKIARHPELMGVSGAMKGSSGLKNEPTPQAVHHHHPSRTARHTPSSAARKNKRQ
ncbi:hypothetical protein MNBD_PLANCTO02-164 [hydrothermal vent metagenome]|uniref:Mce/MlaD domain-containing protein n=1 Tax=hydrothermal vent metagenome TaxID=652676 RepID=A0A3B1D8G3_9ZZZZ